MNSLVDRFIRVVGGQALAAGVATAIAWIAGGNIVDPQYLWITPILGTFLTTLDKFFRDAGIYGSSLESDIKQGKSVILKTEPTGEVTGQIPDGQKVTIDTTPEPSPVVTKPKDTP